MNITISAGVQRWQERFQEDALTALDAALVGRMSLGQYDRARPAEALLQMLSPADISTADEVMQTWLEQRLAKPMPDDLSPKRYADALVEAFRTIHLLPLPNTRHWCMERPAELRAWLRNFILDSSRDPEAALLVMLAHGQNNRRLLFTWMDVIRRGRPVEHVRHALLGLRKMPADDNSAVERGLPRALLRGLLDYGETLVKAGDKKGKPWLEEVDFLAAVYPMSPEVWGRKFRDVLQARDVSKDVHNWLDSRFRVTVNKQDKTTKVFQPPLISETEAILERIKADFKTAIPALKTYLDKHRHYAQDSGDSFYLVRSLRRVGEKLLDYDPTWARELAHEAARWEPSEHRSWSLLARALEEEGDWRRAEAVYWNARRRFPHNSQSHNQLGHALLLHGQAELGETVFRQATQLFPDNPITWAELGHSLRVTGRYEQAVAVYKEAQSLGFNRYPIIANALTSVLIDLNRLDEAEAALQWAEQVVPDDEKNQQVLRKLQSALIRAKNGDSQPPRGLKPLKEITGGNLRDLADITGTDLSHAVSLGKARLLRWQGANGLAKARTELDALHDGSAKLIELGLIISAEQGWQAAFDYFDDCWENYAGDGALRVHRLRAQHRAGETVDWSQERNHYPDLLPVIFTEENNRPPHYKFHLPESELSEEQKQQLWFSDLAEKERLRDWVEEDYLSARQAA
jgi:Flp pilus assembly protein TadD